MRKRKIVLIVLGLCVLAGWAQSCKQGFKAGMQDAKTEQQTEVVKNTEQYKIGMSKYSNVIREKTNENYVVLYEYEEEYQNDITYVYSKIKTKSQLDGKKIKGTTEARFEKGELAYLRVLNTEYTN